MKVMLWSMNNEYIYYIYSILQREKKGAIWPFILTLVRTIIIQHIVIFYKFIEK